MKFSNLDLHPDLQSAIDGLGYENSTPVQEVAIPHILEGRDLAGLAQTGTGKTAAFLIPLMERILRGKGASSSESESSKPRMFGDWKPRQFILILVPTRELADQVHENVLKLGAKSGLRSVAIYGGVAYEKQKQGLRDGVEFIVATPGRLIDLYKEHLVDLKQVRAIVFDEADRMFDMGFKDDMKYVLSRVPRERQFLVFSATLNLDVMNVAYQFGANPVEIDVSRDQAKAENVDDQILHIGNEDKPGHLLSILRKLNPKQTIIFSNFKFNVGRIAQFLTVNGFPAVGISSLLTQSQRTRVMEQFKAQNESNIMVATDVAARGLDIKGVDLVVNYELPDDPENYVHRIGRTGRAGATGHAYSLVSDRDIDALTRIESYLKEKLESAFLEESELVKEFLPMPSDREANRGGPRFSRDAGRSGRSHSSGGPRHGRSGGHGDSRSRRGPDSSDRSRAGSSRRGPPPSAGTGHQRRPGEQSATGEKPRSSSAQHSRHASRPASHGGSHDRGRSGKNNSGRPHRQQPARPSGENRGYRPGQPHRSSPKTNAQPASLGAKVTGFLKRLFGG